MRRSKYIIFDRDGLDSAVVFDDSFHHSDFHHIGKAVSAGFCHINEEGSYTCYGDSVSLRLESRPEDSRLLSKLLGAI